MSKIPTPTTHELDLTAAMATLLRVEKVPLDGDIETVVQRAFEVLWRPATNGWTWAMIKPRLLDALDLAQKLGPIDLDGGSAAC